MLTFEVDGVTYQVQIKDVTPIKQSVSSDQQVVQVDDEKVLLSVSEKDKIVVRVSSIIRVEGSPEGEVKYYPAGTLGVQAFRAVTMDATGRLTHYDASNRYYMDKFIGITLDSGVENELVPVKHIGEVENPAWSWPLVTSIVYAGSDGLLLDHVDTNLNFIQELAVTLSPTKIYIQPKDAMTSDEYLGDYVLGIAGVNLGGHRVVYMDSNGLLFYADSSDVTTMYSVVGVTISATSATQTARVMQEGILVEPTWNWTPGEPVFFDTEGKLTQTAPVSGYVCSVGTALEPTKLNINIGYPIELS